MPKSFRISISTLPLLLIAVYCAAAAGNTYYVATDGSDEEGEGSKAAPWASVQHGINQLRPGDTLHIRAGRYPESLTIRNAGEPDARITIAAYNDEEVILDGTEAVTGWEPVAGDDDGLTVHGEVNRHWKHIYRVDIHRDELPDDQNDWMLFEGGEHSRISRWPDQSVGYGTDADEFQTLPEEAYGEEAKIRDETHFDPGNKEGYWHEYIADMTGEELATYWQDAIAHIWLRYGGNYTVRRNIVGHSDATIELDESVREGRPLRSGDRYSIIRHPHALGSPGEFYFTPRADDEGYYTFYLWPRDTASLEDNDITIPSRGKGIYAIHKPYITIDGLTVLGFTNTGIYFRRVAGGSDEDRHNNGTIIRNCTVMDTDGRAGIWIQSASDSVVENCHVARVSGRGIFSTFSAENVVFRGNVVKDSSSTCLSFYGARRSMMIDNRIHGARGVHANGTSVYLGSRDILMARNTYYNGATATFQNIGNLVFFGNILDGHNAGRNHVATWSDSSNSDYPTQGFQIYAHNTIIRGDSHHHQMLLREAADNYLYNNIIGGTNSMLNAKRRSHNAWVPIGGRWENDAGRINRRGEWEELEEGEWRIPRPELEERLPALFAELDELDYRLNPDPDNPAVGAGKDIQPFLDEMGVKEMFPDFDFSIDHAGRPWNDPPSPGAYEAGLPNNQ